MKSLSNDQSKQLLLCSFVGVFALLFGAVAISPVAGANRVEGNSGITVYRTVRVDDDPVNPISLLKLVDVEDGERAALEVIWRSESSGWFPTWYVELESETGLIPVSGDGPAARIGMAHPSPGGLYEVAISYEYATGVVAVSLFDVQNGKPLITHEDRIGRTATALCSKSPGPPTELGWYQPLGAQWYVVVGKEGHRSHLLQSPEDAAWIRVVTTKPSVGEFGLAVRNPAGDISMELGAISPGETLYPLMVDDLPLGLSQMSLQYIVDGAVMWESRPQDLRIGKVTGYLRGAQLEDDNETLQVTLELAGTTVGVDIDVSATVYQMSWDTHLGNYREEFCTRSITRLASITQDPGRGIDITTEIALPQEEGLWRVHLELVAHPAVATELIGEDIRVSTAMGTVLGTKGAPGGMRIGSYNMLGFEGFPMQPTMLFLGDLDDMRRANHYAHVIRGLDCDIIGIQEGGSVEMMKRIAQSLGKNLVVFPSASRFPGGVFTDYPVIETRMFNHVGPSNQSEPFSRFGGATLLDVDGHLVWVVNFHAWPHEEAMRIREAEILKRQLKQLVEITPNVIVMGDFNSSVGGVFDRQLVALGMVNVMGLDWIGIQPTIAGGEAAIDHIYVSENLVPFVKSGRIQKGPGFDTTNPLGTGEWLNSDHLPVVVEIGWP